MTTSKRSNTIKFLSNKSARNDYVEAHIETGVAFQIKANRVSRDMTQVELGTLAGMKQEAISRLERGGNLPQLETLTRLASAFDVALVVRFVPFGELVEWSDSLGERNLSVPSFASDPMLQHRMEGRVADYQRAQGESE